ncbi:MAG: cation diffusion facilitator family transporter [Angustibacter sp.]
MPWASHDHQHGGPGLARDGQRGRLLLVLLLTLAVVVAQSFGAARSGSLALLADAGHMFTDAAGLLIAIVAITLSARPPTAHRSYGLYRLEILAAVLNAMVLFAAALFILWQAWQRWQRPADIDGPQALVFAVLGLLANGAGLLILHSGARDNLNLKGAYLEVFSDALGSLAVIIAIVVVWLTGWVRADTLVSVAVALAILPRTWALLSEAIEILLEATPRGMNVDEVRAHIEQTPGVLSAHDLHIWTISSGMPVLSAHVVVSDEALADGGGARILDRLGECLAGHFEVRHCTFQLEPPGHAEHEQLSHP